MKKNLLLIVLFITMFLIGDNDVLAYECEIGKDKDCTVDKIKENYKNLACLYEVELTNGEKYYNFIYYKTEKDKLYGGTSLGSMEGDKSLSTKDNAWILGNSAYDKLFEARACPTNSYIDYDNFNEVCFDDDGSCKNSGKKINTGTNFNNTKLSKLVFSDMEIVKTKNITYKNACDRSKWLNGYNGVCRYRSREGNNIVVLYSDTNQLLLHYDAEEGTVALLKNQEKYNYKEVMSTNSSTITYEYNLESKISKINQCPAQLYLNLTESYDVQLYNTTYHSNYEITEAPLYEDDNTKFYDFFPCDGSKGSASPITDCGDLINDDLREVINAIMNVIRIGVPILLIGLITYDFATAVFYGADDKVKKAKDRTIKRIIIAIVIAFVPTLLNLVFNLVNDIWGTNLGTCSIEETE